MSCYSNGFVVSVVIDGRIMKVQKGNQVRVPFETEYSIRLKNKNSTRAVATILIDGENVSGGGWIVRSGQTVTIERPSHSATRFKFVSQNSDEAADAGKSDDRKQKNGVVEVRWRLERATQQPIPYTPRPAWPGTPYYPIPRPRRIPDENQWTRQSDDWGMSRPVVTWESEVALTGSSIGNWNELAESLQRGYIAPTAGAAVMSAQCQVTCGSVPTNESMTAGCTVQGSHSTQQICFEPTGTLEVHETVISLYLLGGEKQFENATSSVSNFCVKCGERRARNDAKYCSNCGSKL